MEKIKEWFLKYKTYLIIIVLMIVIPVGLYFAWKITVPALLFVSTLLSWRKDRQNKKQIEEAQQQAQGAKTEFQRSTSETETYRQIQQAIQSQPPNQPNGIPLPQSPEEDLRRWAKFGDQDNEKPEN